MNSKDKTQIAQSNQQSKEEKKNSPDLFTITVLITTISFVTTILFNILGVAVTIQGLYTNFYDYLNSKNIQVAVNLMNIVVSFFAIIFFSRLYKKISNPSVSIVNKSLYKTITDIPEEQLKQKIHDNLKRVNNLEKQYILFIIIFAISLVAVYLSIIIHSIININQPIPTFRSINPFDFLTNIINFSGAVFIFLAFKVLHDDTLQPDHISSTNFAVLPGALSFLYLLGVGLTYLVCFGVENTYGKEITETIRGKITVAINITDLAAGLANGLTMTLLFGRYVAIEFSSRSTKTFLITREILHKRFSYTKFISTTIIWFLPFYALAQPLFGSLTIDAFGKPEVFQTVVFAICLVGKILFFVITYIILKENVMNLYMHGVVAKVGNPKELEKCLKFDNSDSFSSPAQTGE